MRTKYIVVLAALSLAMSGSAQAENMIVDGLKIAEACTGDVERICTGVAPGEGRISSCLKNNVGKLSVNCVDSVLGALIDAHDRDVNIRLSPGAVPGEEVHLANARDYAYCEIAPVIRVNGEVEAQFYNTTATEGPRGGCPADAFAAIDAKKLSEELGAALTYMNPTPQTARRHWVMDETWVFAKGETVNFNGVDSTWMASMSPQMMLSAVAAPYEGVQIHRKSKYLYKKGSTVFLMRPAGQTVAYVMQSYATEVDPSLSFGKLSGLGLKLQLPAGWTFEAKVLDQDLMVDPRDADGVAHIIRDDLHNVYEGCGFDATCNFTP